MASTLPPAPSSSAVAQRPLPRWAVLLLCSCALVPLTFVGLQALSLIKDIPMWDEFETVLRFLMSIQDAPTFRDAARLFFSLSNEHCMLTSRAIMVIWLKLTGGINFAAMAVIGDLFILGFVALLVRQESDRRMRLFLLALAGLLLFNFQHHENFFSSYASIDHFQVVLLAAGSMALLRRGTPLSATGAAVLAVAAVFTLTHGLAVFAGGAVMLIVQKRWKVLGLWSALGLALVLWFAQRLPTSRMPMLATTDLGGFLKTLYFWCRLLGGLPSLGDPLTTRAWGIALLVLVAATLVTRAYRRDLFLFALLVNCVVAAAMIAYGRSNISAVPPLSSRYMVQSAVAWLAVVMLLLKQVPDWRWQKIAATATLVLALAVNVLGTLKFMPSAREFVQRRVDAAWHYDLKGTFDGLKHPIFPNARNADYLVARAASSGLYHLAAPHSPEVELSVPVKERPMTYVFDRMEIGSQSLHIRGWMLPKGQDGSDHTPYLQLMYHERAYVFRGFKEYRPDVALSMHRRDALDSGFYFVIPRDELPLGDFSVTLMLADHQEALFARTHHHIQLSPPSPPQRVAGIGEF